MDSVSGSIEVKFFIDGTTSSVLPLCTHLHWGIKGSTPPIRWGDVIPFPCSTIPPPSQASRAGSVESSGGTGKRKPTADAAAEQFLIKKKKREEESTAAGTALSKERRNVLHCLLPDDIKFEDDARPNSLATDTADGIKVASDAIRTKVGGIRKRHKSRAFKSSGGKEITSNLNKIAYFSIVETISGKLPSASALDGKNTASAVKCSPSLLGKTVAKAMGEIAGTSAAPVGGFTFGDADDDDCLLYSALRDCKDAYPPVAGLITCGRLGSHSHGPLEGGQLGTRSLDPKPAGLGSKAQDSGLDLASKPITSPKLALAPVAVPKPVPVLKLVVVPQTLTSEPAPTLPALASEPASTLPALASEPAPTPQALASEPASTLPALASEPASTLPALASEPASTLPALASEPASTLQALASKPAPNPAAIPESGPIVSEPEKPVPAPELAPSTAVSHQGPEPVSSLLAPSYLTITPQPSVIYPQALQSAEQKPMMPEALSLTRNLASQRPPLGTDIGSAMAAADSTLSAAAPVPAGVVAPVPAGVVAPVPAGVVTPLPAGVVAPVPAGVAAVAPVPAEVAEVPRAIVSAYGAASEVKLTGVHEVKADPHRKAKADHRHMLKAQAGPAEPPAGGKSSQSKVVAKSHAGQKGEAGTQKSAHHKKAALARAPSSRRTQLIHLLRVSSESLLVNSGQ